MSQNDFVIADQTFPEMLTDLNGAYQALASLSAGAAGPPTTYPFQLWGDTANNLLMMRNKANNAWLTLASINPGTDRWELRVDLVQALTAAGFTFKSSTGATIASLSNAGTLSGVNVTIGAAKTLNLSAGSVIFADDQIDGAKVKAFTALLKGVVPPPGAGSARRLLRPDGLWSEPVFWDYESAETSLPSSGFLTFVHGLGARPKLHQVVLRCTTAANGYSVGDEIPVYDYGNDPYLYNALTSMDATSIVLSKQGSGWAIVPKAGGGAVVSTPENYRLVARAKL